MDTVKTLAMDGWINTLYRLDAERMRAVMARQNAEAEFWATNKSEAAVAGLMAAAKVAEAARQAVLAHEATNPLTDAEELAYWIAREVRDDVADADITALVRNYVRTVSMRV